MKIPGTAIQGVKTPLSISSLLAADRERNIQVQLAIDIMNYELRVSEYASLYELQLKVIVYECR